VTRNFIYKTTCGLDQQAMHTNVSGLMKTVQMTYDIDPIFVPQ